MTLAKHFNGLHRGADASARADYAGQPFHLLPWQRRFLRGAFKPGVMDAAL